jgi:hypothetical protein
LEYVTPLHKPSWGPEGTIALVLVNRPRTKSRLLSHHPLPIYFLVIPSGIMDLPVAKEELGFFLTLVLHFYMIGKHEPSLAEGGVRQ